MTRCRSFTSKKKRRCASLAQLMGANREVRFRCGLPVAKTGHKPAAAAAADEEPAAVQPRTTMLINLERCASSRSRRNNAGSPSPASGRPPGNPLLPSRFASSLSFEPGSPQARLGTFSCTKRIPDDSLAIAFLWLSGQQLRGCARVCKEWRVVIRASRILSVKEKEFEWTGTDYDGEGIIYYHGTLFGTRSKWANPAKLCVCPLTVSSSSSAGRPLSLNSRGGAPDAGRSHDIAALAHRCVSHYQTDSLPFSWVAFDFGPVSVCPTWYTVGTSTVLKSYPVSWKLFGSNHCSSASASLFTADMWQNWFLLDEVQGAEFRADCLSKTFPVKGPSPGRFETGISYVNTWSVGFYRHLRLVQTGLNQQYGHVLTVSGIEFYGHVKRTSHFC
ncbi:hypothetical protein DIPPA_05221 [Diplonema papillatum]|nr:hypothetical protein DIPPA_05221 [Diplonema papillatum]